MGVTSGRRRVVNVIASAGLVLGLAAGLSTGLASCTAKKPVAESTRPLADGELKRLAGMRVVNYEDARVGLRGTVGPASRKTRVAGWIDWRREVVYLSVTDPEGGTALVQAVPGVLAVRTGPVGPASASTGPDSDAAAPGLPPVDPPEDGWRARPIQLGGDEQRPLDNLVSFLFLLARPDRDPADLLGTLKNQYVRRDAFEGTPVDVLLGPALLPQTGPAAPSAAPGLTPTASSNSAADTEPDDGTLDEANMAASAAPSGSPEPSYAPDSLEAHGGAVGYWLDDKGALRRLETVLATGLPATVDLLRDQQQEFTRTAVLGGQPNNPTKITEKEAEMLSRLRQRNLRARGGKVTLTMPVLPGTLRLGTGWLDWQRHLSYLAVHDSDDTDYDVLVHADRTGVATRKTGKKATEVPPLPAPKGDWDRAEWADLGTKTEITDLDYLVHEAMSLAAGTPDDAAHIRQHGRRLRVDVLRGVPVGVFELPTAVEVNVPAGMARMRYWVDNSGVLQRLELRTATGGFAQLDLDLSDPLPALPPRVY
ncbi:hypothetical protein Cs7R123_22100 [Catellatospora sp. TT07R-123]|uniref:hypothetical protein n=1 Tax=Catellatospora sp. TT07R-123 TaxID=2733863 RepID=UPI001B24A6C7|nr:hypothetical protein [Catellatospora sp. TT07R-123]GHJ44868.1 hypothetical protein Cs7R123_22100 [Catellatospora sp. TT07R-123]